LQEVDKNIMTDNLQVVDHTALRVNQAFIIALCVAAFITDSVGLIALVALVMISGTIINKPGFGFIYATIFKPLGWLKPDLLRDNPEPHRFAQGFGGIVMIGAVTALWLGASQVGWILAWIVIMLAALNLLVGFCVGCAFYYWLQRSRIPRFDKKPPANTFPGMRPGPR
jgi:hypothetical protein